MNIHINSNFINAFEEKRSIGSFDSNVFEIVLTALPLVNKRVLKEMDLSHADSDEIRRAELIVWLYYYLIKGKISEPNFFNLCEHLSEITKISYLTTDAKLIIRPGYLDLGTAPIFVKKDGTKQSGMKLCSIEFATDEASAQSKMNPASSGCLVAFIFLPLTIIGRFIEQTIN